MNSRTAACDRRAAFSEIRAFMRLSSFYAAEIMSMLLCRWIHVCLRFPRKVGMLSCYECELMEKSRGSSVGGVVRGVTWNGVWREF